MGGGGTLIVLLIVLIATSCQRDTTFGSPGTTTTDFPWPRVCALSSGASPPPPQAARVIAERTAVKEGMQTGSTETTETGDFTVGP